MVVATSEVSQQAEKTVMFLQENCQCENKGDFELQKHIDAYSQTREIYANYRKLTGRKQAEF
ncbi:hypothetical protein [Oscillibacter sp. 1-3]|uniref:hypothetical protein n=1 Tax=Oscillibacter sp. 1-3 TaxID=1235797 RepID=UPI001FA6F128|nr:hypothetical protein [Oscillibacter sp. 1-3]